MKKTISGILLALVAVFALVACGKDDETTTLGTAATEDKKEVLNFWCWNNEFMVRMEDFYPDYKSKNEAGDIFTLKDGNQIKWVQVDNAGGGYQAALDAGMKAGMVDMFLFESDYSQKYVNSKNIVPLENLNIAATDISHQYKYTQDVVTNAAGKIVGSSWQATPGVFMYNVAYAKAILGTDYSTAKVSELTDTWAEFDAFAKTVEEYAGTINFATLLGDNANLPAEYKASGAKATQTIVAKDLAMLAGMDDMYRVYSNNATIAMYDSTSKNIKLDTKLWDWVEKTNDYASKGYLAGVGDGYQLWGGNWGAAQKFDGKTFGTFGCPWYVDFCLIGNNLNPDVTEGDNNAKCVKGSWNVVKGPQGFFWGGTWMAATPTGMANMPVTIKDIILDMTCDKDVATKIAKKYGDFTNYKEAMNEMAADTTYQQPFMLQNTFTVYAAGVDSIKIIASAYDQYINEEFQNAMHAYFVTTVKGLTATDEGYGTMQTGFIAFEKALRGKATFNTLVSNKEGIADIAKA